MSFVRIAVTALAGLVLTACGGEAAPSVPASGGPIGTAAAAQDGATVCATLQRTTDVMLLETGPDTNEAGYEGTTFFTGVTKHGNPGYTLLVFDVSSIPIGVQVTSATVTVTPNAARGLGTVNAHAILGPWDPTTVTWDNFSAGFDPTPAGSFPSGLAPWSAEPIVSGFSPATFDLTGLVQQWVSGAAVNDGILLEQSLVEPEDPSYTYYDDAVAIPTLSVCYEDLCAGVTCTASDACHVAGTCDPATGLCNNPLSGNPACGTGAGSGFGQPCNVNGDCYSQSCVSGQCAAPSNVGATVASTATYGTTPQVNPAVQVLPPAIGAQCYHVTGGLRCANNAGVQAALAGVGAGSILVSSSSGDGGGGGGGGGGGWGFSFGVSGGLSFPGLSSPTFDIPGFDIPWPNLFLSLDFDWLAHITLIDVDVSGLNLFSTDTGSVTITNGGLDVGADLDVNGAIDLLGLSKLGVIFSPQLTAELAIDGSFSDVASQSGSTTIWEDDIVLTQFAGPIPVVEVLTLGVDLGYEFCAGGAIDVDGGASFSLGVQAGFQYDRPNLSLIGDVEAPSFTPVGPTVGLEGAVALKVFLRPRVSLSIYGLGGPGIALVPYARFDASFDGGTCPPASWALGAGMDIEFSGDMGGFGVPCLPPAQAETNIADTVLAQGEAGPCNLGLVGLPASCTPTSAPAPAVGCSSFNAWPPSGGGSTSSGGSSGAGSSGGSPSGGSSGAGGSSGGSTGASGGSGAASSGSSGGTNLCAGVVCTALDACHVAGTCDPSTGACSNPAQPDGTACDDGDACTAGDTCQAGACTPGSPVVCAPVDACHAAGTCSPATGCAPGALLVTTITGNYTLGNAAAAAALACVGSVTGTLTIAGDASVPSVSLPYLQTVGGLTVTAGSLVSTLSLGGLTTAGTVTASQNPALTGVDLGALVSAHAITFSSDPALTLLDLSSLESVAIDMIVNSTAITSFGAGGLSSLVTVGRNLQIEQDPELADLGPTSLLNLASVGGPSLGGIFYFQDNPLVTEIDASNAVLNGFWLASNAALTTFRPGPLPASVDYAIVTGSPLLTDLGPTGLSPIHAVAIDMMVNDTALASLGPTGLEDLVSVGRNLEIVQDPELTDLGPTSLSNLASVGGPSLGGIFYFQDNPLVTEIDASNAALNGFWLATNPALTAFRLGNMPANVDYAIITGSPLLGDLGATGLSPIHAVTIDMMVNDTALASLGPTGLSSLVSVGRNLEIVQDPELTDLGPTSLSNLASVGGPSLGGVFYFQNNALVSTVDVSSASLNGFWVSGDPALTAFRLGNVPANVDYAILSDLPLLTDLGASGMSPIETVTIDLIVSDTALASLGPTGLGDLVSVGRNLQVTSNPDLTTLAPSGLTALTSVGSTAFGGGLSIESDPSLTTADLPALSSVTGNLIVSGNTALSQLLLGDLVHVGGNLQITSNPALPTCFNALIAQLVGYTGTVTIASDGPACP